MVSRVSPRPSRRGCWVVVGFDRLSERTGLAALPRINVERTASHIVGRVVFWILMLTFLLFASDLPGLDGRSATIDRLVQCLPRVLGAVFILAIGLFPRDCSPATRYAPALVIGQIELET